jgi:hypothetical protein
MRLADRFVAFSSIEQIIFMEAFMRERTKHMIMFFGETMVIIRFRPLFLVALPFFLVACIETQNVNIFAGSVTVVTDATSKMIDSDRATCANINATISEIETLPNIGQIGSANCADLGKVLDAIAGVNKVLGNYGKALGDIAQNTFINYDSDVNTFSGRFVMKSAGTSTSCSNSKNSPQVLAPGRFDSTTSPVASSRVTYTSSPSKRKPAGRRTA